MLPTIHPAEWKYDPISNQASIVLIGSFNPVIFQPHWLRNLGIIGQSEEDEINENGFELIHKELTRFRTSWMTFEGDRNKISVSNVDEPFGRALDLIVGIFDALQHTPITKFGLNRQVQFTMNSVEAWHVFGDRLAPKADWDFLLGSQEGARTGGLVGLAMRRTKRPDDEKGHITVTVLADAVQERKCTIEINDHFDVADEKNVRGADEAMRTMRIRWDDSQCRSSQIIGALMNVAAREER